MPLLDKRTDSRRVRFLARCTAAHCSSVTSALVDVTTTTALYGLPTGGGHQRQTRHSYELVEDGTGWKVVGPFDNYLEPTDPCGHAAMSVVPVRGRTTETACNERCEDARRPDCECSCGGLNHGSSWS